MPGNAKQNSRSPKSIGRQVIETVGQRRLILSAGMPRSASTLLYNLLRLSLEQGSGVLAAGWIEDIGKLPEASVYLLKVHRVDELLAKRADYSFYSYRDVRDALVSASRRFGITPSLEVCDEYMREYEAAKRYASQCFRFETLTSDPLQVVEQLALCMGLSIDAARVLEQVPIPRVDLEPVSSYDPKSLFHGGHGTGTAPGTWQSTLDDSLVSSIHQRYHRFFQENGYSVPGS